jgi:hypothetical protein
VRISNNVYNLNSVYAYGRACGVLTRHWDWRIQMIENNVKNIILINK